MNRLIKRVLAATDFSKYSDAAVERALDMSRALGAELVVLHVMEPIMNPPYFGFESEVESVVDAAKAHLESFLEAIPDSIKKDVPIQPLLRSGKANEVIPTICEERQIDLAVIGSHGHSSLEKMLFLGSTADKLMHKIGCSIMVVKIA